MTREVIFEELKQDERILEQIKKSEPGLEKVLDQLEMFRRGLPFVKIVKPAALNSGINSINENTYPYYLNLHKEAAGKGRFLKFVPASGAASRMFKALSTVFNEYPGIDYRKLKNLAEKDKNARAVLIFFENIRDYAFFDDLKNAFSKDGLDIDEEIETGSVYLLLQYVLTEKGLALAALPKGFIPFHKYGETVRTPFHEHLIEAAEYIKDAGGTARLHFTVPSGHLEKIKEHLDEKAAEIQSKSGIKFEINLSTQMKSTDTIAVNPDNTPYTDENGKIFFRPGGHGALLDNIQETGGDILYIKNVDNVAPDRLKDDTHLYKKLLGGYFVDADRKIKSFLRNAESGNADESEISEIAEFAKNRLNITLPSDFSERSLQEQISFLFEVLNKPLRVCGMVKNEGEPGGGPFFTEDQKGRISLQIVETSQINTDDENQKAILEKATHFNPVDLVCGIRNYKGEIFNLKEFSDPETAFITTKYINGREIKALELPGLWNGAMAGWNTIFVETPITTFSPVKTVNDLLRNEHK